MTKGTPLTEEEIMEAEQAMNMPEDLETTVDNVETL